MDLVAKYDEGKEFLIFSGNNERINSVNEIALDISQKNMYPKFVAKNGLLMFETFNSTGNNSVGNPETYSIPSLILRYEYSYESRMYSKDIPIENTSSIATAISSEGRNKTDLVKYEKN